MFGFTLSGHSSACTDPDEVSIKSENSVLILVKMLYHESMQGLDHNTYCATKLGEDPKPLTMKTADYFRKF